MPTRRGLRFEIVDDLRFSAARLFVAGGRRYEGHVVAELAVDFVGDEGDVVPLGQFGQAAHFGLAGHDARRVGRAVDENQLRAGGDGLGDPVEIDAEIGVGVDHDRHAAHQAHKRQRSSHCINKSQTIRVRRLLLPRFR